MQHLPLETCQRLKEAGFPQNTKLQYFEFYNWLNRPYVNYPMTSYDYYERMGVKLNKEQLIAHCPNSDELLEQIENEFKGVQDIVLRYKRDFVYVHLLKPRIVKSFEGTTIVECLAELYIELKANAKTSD